MTGATVGPSQRRVTALRLAFGGIGAAVLVLGYIGLRQYLRSYPAYGHGFLDIAYDDLQLFVLGADPLQQGGTIPPALQVARFGAPLVTLLAVIEAVRLLFADEVYRLRARRSRGHAVICGDSTVARTLAVRLRDEGRRVVVIRSQPTGPLELRRPGILGVEGDATDSDVLRAAGIEHAELVYAATESSTTNVSIAFAASRLLSGREAPAAIYAQVHDADLCISLQARRLGLARPPGPRLDFFNVDDLAARVLITRERLADSTTDAPRLLIAGGSAFARALLVEAARRWRLYAAPGKRPLTVNYVADDASATLTVLSNRYPFLNETCRITAYDVPLPILLAASVLDEPHDRAFICYRDEEEGLRIALTTHGLWYGGFRSVVVPFDRLASLTAAFHGGTGEPLFDEVRGTLRLFPLVEAACERVLTGEDLVERLARLIHERYVLAHRRQADLDLNGGDPDGGDPDWAAVEWADLDDEGRRMNRSQAADIGAKLEEIGCSVVPRTGVHSPFTLTAAEIDQLARREHERWKREREASGWRFGAARSDELRLNPYLADWESLSEECRARNYDTISETPHLLADAGFDIVRVFNKRAELVRTDR
jgi:hypothetical protein